MKTLRGSGPWVGIAYAGYAMEPLQSDPTLVDYLEIPFELLRHDPTAIAVGSEFPIILHCASLSLAGTVPPSDTLLVEIADWIRRTNTPWLGEHLSFITADRAEAGLHVDEYAPGQPYNLGYTVSPPMNAESVSSVSRNVRQYADRFATPILLENPPLYFGTPGSTLEQAEFVREICQAVDVNLLLDLTHLAITAFNTGVDPFSMLARYPVERVTEVHISGATIEEGACWDDHASPASDLVYALFASLLERTTPRAVTLEYNWSSQFPPELLRSEIARAREALRCARSLPAQTMQG